MIVNYDESWFVSDLTLFLLTKNLDLTQDARAARTYRDELDVYKEKVRDLVKGL